MFLRLSVDLFFCLFAYGLFRQHRDAYKFQLTSHVYGEDITCKEISILSYAPCTINYLRFDFRFGQYLHQPDQITFYLDIHVTRGFSDIFLILPFKLLLNIREENEDFIFEGKENDDFLFLVEKNPNSKAPEILTIKMFITAKVYIHEIHGRRTFIFPISHHYWVGTPFDESRECPHIFSTKEGDLSHPWHVPEVKLLRVNISNYSNVFEPELERTYPPPDIFIVDETHTGLQWLSGAGCHRPYHSSIQIGFVNKEVLEKGVEKSFKSGVMLAISLSLIIATGLDALWQILSEIPWCEVFKIAKLKLVSLYIAAQTMALPFLSYFN